jgi:hypothetical protein
MQFFTRLGLELVIFGADCISKFKPIFYQMIGIPMGTNCALLLAYLFYMLMRQTFFKVFSRIKRENYPRHLIPASAI